MYNFCTLFDSFYLSRGLVMYESLKKNLDNFHLYIFAFDDLCYNILDKLKPDNTTIISLKKFENEELLKVKNDRTKAEYCWTSTPWTIKHVFEKYKVQECTYIDADLMFYNNPVILLNEMKSDSSTLITEHRYSKLEKIYEEKRAGKFCVQFIAFNTSLESKKILNNWANQCIEWCYNRYEEGKFGDQKYLDEWPHKYKGIHILENEGGGVAPWNVKKYKFIETTDGEISLKKKGSKDVFKLVFFHFQSLRLKDDITADMGWHYINRKLRKIIYSAYINNLIDIEKMLAEKYSDYTIQYYNPRNTSFKELIKNSFKRITSFNIFKI